MVGRDPPLAAAERVDAVDAEDVGLDPLDLRAERDEEAAEILDVRLAGRVPDHGLAGSEHGGHDRVLGRHHARLVEEDVVAPQAAGRLQLVMHLPELDLCAQPRERVDVRIETAPPDHVAARRRDGRAPEPREQRAGEQERRAHACAELRVELVPGHVRRMDAHLVRAGPRDLGAELVEQVEHRLHVADARHVRERHRLARQQRRGQDRQRAVLVAGRLDGSAQGDVLPR